MNLNEDLVNEEKARLALTKVFCYEMSPPKAVEDKDFKEIVQMLDPQLHVSFDFVRFWCLKFFKEEREKIKRTLRNLDGQISLSVDILSSTKPGKSGSDYLCLTAYFIDDNWEMQKWIINFTCVGHQSQAALHEVILNSLKEWGIEKKISTITMSNSSIYDETIEIVKDHIRGKKELPLNGRLFRVCCCSDIVSLMVQDANKEISKIVDKIGSMYSFKEPEPSWYNKNNQIKEASLLHSRGTFSCRYRDSRNDKPSAKELRKVRNINRYIDDIYGIVFPLFGMGYSTASIYLHHLQELRAYFIRWSRSNNVLTNVSKKLLQSFSKYMNNMYLVLAIASVMDPRFKMKYIEFSSLKFKGDYSYSKVLKAMHKLYNDYVKIENDSNGTLSLLQEYKLFLRSSSSRQVKSELDLYLEEPVIGWSQDFNALTWWKAASSKYPTLSRIARDVLVIPISVATSDKAFYTQKREADEGMISLGPDLMAAVMFFRSWFVKHKVLGNQNLHKNENDTKSVVTRLIIPKKEEAQFPWGQT
ncbi:hypothetical protein ACSBR2_039452 [Camellia fascicularis]